MRKTVAIFLVGAMMAMTFAGCGNSSSNGTSSGSGDTTAVTEAKNEEGGEQTNVGAVSKICTITDTGGINDQSFNQSVWEGLQQVSKDTGVEVSYLESKQTSEFITNMDKMIDAGNQLIWGNGYTVADATLEAAQLNLDVTFGVIDFAFSEAPENVFGVTFRAQESSFLAGYVAGRTTTTDHVGFVGGQKSDTIDAFEWGYKAGVAYAGKELGKEIQVDSQYAETFADSAKGKAIANKMYNSGADVIFHAAGGTGLGVIEAAKEANKWVIGVDRDQAYLAPDNVLTSAMKNVNVAVIDLSTKMFNGEQIGGQNYEYGLADGSVGLAEGHDNIDDKVYEDTMKLQEELKAGNITAPANEEEYNSYVSNL